MSGVGVAKTDESDFKQGTFLANPGFPNEGRSWANPTPGEFVAADVKSLNGNYIRTDDWVLD
jgi:hypothetical protein